MSDFAPMTTEKQSACVRIDSQFLFDSNTTRDDCINDEDAKKHQNYSIFDAN